MKKYLAIFLSLLLFIIALLYLLSVGNISLLFSPISILTVIWGIFFLLIILLLVNLKFSFFSISVYSSQLVMSIILILSLIINIAFFTQEISPSSDTQSNDTGSANTAVSGVYLDLSSIDFPNKVGPCGTIKFSVKAKNIGDKALTYAEVADKKYEFYIKYIADSTVIATTKNGSLELNDFGVLKPGEKRTIDFYMSPREYKANAFSGFEYTDIFTNKADYKTSHKVQLVMIFSKIISDSESSILTTYGGLKFNTMLDFSVLYGESDGESYLLSTDQACK